MPLSSSPKTNCKKKSTGTIPWDAFELAKILCEYFPILCGNTMMNRIIPKVNLLVSVLEGNNLEGLSFVLRFNLDKFIVYMWCERKLS